MRGVRRRALLAGILALAAVPLFSGSPTGVASQPSAVFSIDSAQVTVGGSSEARLRITAAPPGVAGYHLDIRYDPAKIIVTGCAPEIICSIDTLKPNTVRFSDANLGGYGGSGVPVGTVKFQVIGGQGTTSLAIDEASLSAVGTDTLPLTDVDVQDGTIVVVSAVVSGDLDCSGAVGLADAIAALRFAATGKITAKPGCTPTGNVIDGKLWGDQDGNGAVDAGDALDLLLQVAL